VRGSLVKKNKKTPVFRRSLGGKWYNWLENIVFGMFPHTTVPMERRPSLHLVIWRMRCSLVVV